MIGGFLASWYCCRKRSIPLLQWADVAAPSVVLGTAITRVGCFLFGCDYGARSSLPWAVRFPGRTRWRRTAARPGSTTCSDFGLPRDRGLVVPGAPDADLRVAGRAVPVRAADADPPLPARSPGRCSWAGCSATASCARSSRSCATTTISAADVGGAVDVADHRHRVGRCWGSACWSRCCASTAAIRRARGSGCSPPWRRRAAAARVEGRTTAAASAASGVDATPLAPSRWRRRSRAAVRRRRARRRPARAAPAPAPPAPRRRRPRPAPSPAAAAPSPADARAKARGRAAAPRKAAQDLEAQVIELRRDRSRRSSASAPSVDDIRRRLDELDGAPGARTIAATTRSPTGGGARRRCSSSATTASPSARRTGASCCVPHLRLQTVYDGRARVAGDRGRGAARHVRRSRSPTPR